MGCYVVGRKLIYFIEEKAMNNLSYTESIEEAKQATQPTILYVPAVAEYEDGEANTEWGYMPDCVRVIVEPTREAFMQAAKSLGFRETVQQDIDNNTPQAKAHREHMNAYAVLG
jgi:hypothetical protein